MAKFTKKPEEKIRIGVALAKICFETMKSADHLDVWTEFTIGMDLLVDHPNKNKEKKDAKRSS